MRRIPGIIIAIAISGLHTYCYAGCDCDDWMEKGGYCVDYIKSKIPTFPVPQNTSEIAVLKNKDIPEVTEGDVAIFNLGNYWHVAYVEKVHDNQRGDATAIDVSEMNFGEQMSFHEFRNEWKSNSETEWRRALCCGITDNYDQTSSRKNVALKTVKQIWSPSSAASEGAGRRQANIVFDKIREVLNQFF